MLNLEKSAAAFAEAEGTYAWRCKQSGAILSQHGLQSAFIARAAGSKIYDIDGNEYIDYVGSWGPMVVGHAHPPVVKALQAAAERGTSYGAPTLLETAGAAGYGIDAVH